jgi:hypothetical protein
VQRNFVVGGTLFFTLGSKYIPTHTFSASGLLSATDYTSRTNNFFFGFLGGKSSGSTLIIENIRFYSASLPKLQITFAGNQTILTWPPWATNYLIQASPSLKTAVWNQPPLGRVITGIP